MKILIWHYKGMPTTYGKYLLYLDDGDYIVDNAYVPGSHWCCIRKVICWAKF